MIYSAYFGAMYLLGAQYVDRPGFMWSVPLRKLGSISIVVLSYLLSYHWPWEDIGWNYYRTGSQYVQWAALADYLILVISIFAAVFLLMRMVKRNKPFETVFGLLPVVAVLGYVLSGAGTGYLSGWLLSAYTLSLGIVSILTGLKERRIGITNAGIVVVGLIILSRFLEFDVGILTRALVFIFVGICFLVSNVILSKKLKGGTR